MRSYYETKLGKLYCGRGQDILKQLPDNSIDSLLTDPPAGISFMNKSWDKNKGGRDKWIEWLTGIMKEAYRVMKPGAYGFVWAIPRTSHWTAMALENAGFQIKDIVMHIFGSGFPKSLNISKKIDQMAGAERQIIGTKKRGSVQDAKERGVGYLSDPANKNNSKQFGYGTEEITEPATPEAKLWDGYGTALKPAAEHWIMIAKPNDGTYADNALKWGVAGLNIDGGRIPVDSIIDKSQIRTMNRAQKEEKNGWGMNQKNDDTPQAVSPQGRFPANVILDGSDEVEQLFPKSSITGNRKKKDRIQQTLANTPFTRGKKAPEYTDSGSASRFFYCAKPSKAERNAGCEDLELKRHADRNKTDGVGGDNPRNRTNAAKHNFHPTVKSLALMKYLCNLTKTPMGGIVLDLFAGSGTTAIACEQLGRKWIGIEKEEEYCEIAVKRIEKAILQ